MKKIEWIKETPIAHRGLHTKDKKVPENSLAAFENAIKNNYPIELDLNILKDGIVVCFHDEDLKRMTGDNRKLMDVTYEEIKDLSLLSTNQKIPIISDVINLVKGQVPLLIEIKHHFQPIQISQTLMEVMATYQGLWAVQAFHPKILLWFKKHHPSIPRGQISEYFLEEDISKIEKYILKTLKPNFLTKPDFINYGLRDMPNRYLKKAKRKGLPIIGYTAKTQKDYDFVKQHYDNAVFEFFVPKK